MSSRRWSADRCERAWVTGSTVQRTALRSHEPWERQNGEVGVLGISKHRSRRVAHNAWPLLTAAAAAAVLTAIAPASAFGSGQRAIITVAGSERGLFGYRGDGGPATLAYLRAPEGVAVDTHGDVYIADGANLRVRKVNPEGIITTFAGTGTNGSSCDHGPATSAQVYPSGVAVDAQGNVYIAECLNHRVRKVN